MNLLIFLVRAVFKRPRKLIPKEVEMRDGKIKACSVSCLSVFENAKRRK